MKLTPRELTRVIKHNGIDYVPISMLEEKRDYSYTYAKGKDEQLKLSKKLVVAGMSPKEAVAEAAEWAQEYYDQVIARKD